MPESEIGDAMKNSGKRRAPYILVVGANFENQGAFLMLATVARELRERFAARVVLDARLGAASDRRGVGAYTLIPGRVDRLAPWFLTRAARAFGTTLVQKNEIDAVVDVSGFRYGDPWARLGLRKYSSRLAEYAARGVPVYMLPQAFGPFKKPDVRVATVEAISASTMVFARDPESLRHVQALLADSRVEQQIRESPDFTGPTPGSKSETSIKFAGRVPIIPNRNIYDRAPSQEARDTYVDALVALADEARALGYEPYGLSHEGVGDERTLSLVTERIPGLEVVTELDGLALKGVIAEAPFIVSGRFHAVSSGLSQGVPVLTHSWSHKYRWLAAEYGAESFVIDPYSDIAGQRDALRRMVTDSRLSARLADRGTLVDSAVSSMWDAVISDLQSRIA